MTAAIRPRDVLHDYELYAPRFLRIQDKHGAIIPLRPNRAQRHYLKNKGLFNVVVKPRQIGFSTHVQGENAHAVTTSPIHSLTLADKSENTQKLRRIFKRFFLNWPEGIPAPIRDEDSRIIMTFPELNSSASIATAGSETAGLGGTYHFFHASEAAYWNNPLDVLSGALQAVVRGGYVVFESTPNGAQGWFYEMAMQALDGDSRYKLHFYPWWYEPGYAEEPEEPLIYTPEERALVDNHGLTPAQINWRRGKILDLKHLFIQSYPEDIHTCFLRSGEGYFGDISPALTTDRFERQDSHTYVAGLDFGQTTDYTVLSIGDVDAGQQVEVYRINKLSHHDMMERIIDRCEAWGVRTLIPEWNSIGAVNIEILRRIARERGLTMSIGRFNTTTQSKPPLINGLYHAIHSGALKLLDMPELRREFQAFIASQTPSGHWKYEASQGNHDDIVIATGIMWHAMNRPSAVFVEL